MRLLIPLTVFVVAILTSQARTNASEPSQQKTTKAKTVSATSAGSQPRFPTNNGFDQWRHEPDLGADGSPSSGFKHFPFRSHMHTIWHRPKAATLTKCQRCAPDSFRPRGFGRLFARPCDSFRMEYTPHVVADSRSEYGPSYLRRSADPRCEDCGH